MKHKHYECIVAWAEGKEIQVRYEKHDWEDLATSYPGWYPHQEYRIKPESQEEKEQEPVLWVHIKTLDRTIRQGTSGAFWHKFPDGYGLSKEEFIPLYTQPLKKASEK